MLADDAAVEDVLRRAMVVRIATLSRNGRPSVNPLWFVPRNGRIWLGTPDWTLAARNVRSDPRVSLLFEVERDSTDPRLLRIDGRAELRTDPEIQRVYLPRVALKYFLTPGGVWNLLTHPRQLRFFPAYQAQGKAKGRPAVIEVTPEHAEFVAGGSPQR